MKIDLELYAVMNSDGQFFRAKGYGGSGETWVDDISKAKIYPKIGSAKSRVTYFSNAFPEYPPPKIIKLKVFEYEVIDQAKEVAEAKKKKELRAKKTLLAKCKKDMKNAEKAFKDAERALEAKQKEYEKNLEPLSK